MVPDDDIMVAYLGEKIAEEATNLLRMHLRCALLRRMLC